MKKLITIFSVLSIFLMQSCSNEFALTENWKDITIVYGLLDASDTAQYIRVQKAFLDEKTNALILAQEADSLFYDNITVRLQSLPPSGASGGELITLTRVDANLEGFPKESGIFATSPNYVYKLSKPLKPDFSYKIIVEKPNDAQEVTAFTEVINNFDITFPPSGYDELNFASNRNLQVRWRKDADATFYDGVMRINYTEAPANNPSNVVSKSLDWSIFRNLAKETGAGLMIYEIEGVAFYKHLQSNLQEGSFIRNFVDADIFIYAGGEELNNYINSGRASSGVTSAETLPVYTNINNGLGIFSTRYTQSAVDMLAKQAMLDTLSAGPYTKNLGFQ
jgi:hypothetical protein